MSMQRYSVQLAPDRQVTAYLDTTWTIKQIITDLIAEHKLPVHDSNGRTIPYALYNDPGRRLASELTLQQVGYDEGGELRLADWFAPWWEAATPPQQQALLVGQRTLLLAAAIGGVALLCVAGFVVAAVLLPAMRRGSSGPAGAVRAATATAQRRATLSAPTDAPVAPTDALATPIELPITALAQPLTTTPIEVAIAAPTETATLAPTETAPAVEPTTPPAETATAAPTAVPAEATTAPTEAPTAAPTAAAAPPRTLQAQHILPENRDRDPRLFFRYNADFGAYLWAEPALQNKVPATVGNVVISNGDTLEILDDSQPDLYHVRVVTNALDGSDLKVQGATGWMKAWLVDATVPPPPPPPPPASPTPIRRLRFVVLNYNDNPACISVRITGISTAGWIFSVDGMRLVGRFNGGNARVCGLGPKQEVTISVKNGQGVVLGGSGVPSRGSAIMQAAWR